LVSIFLILIKTSVDLGKSLMKNGKKKSQIIQTIQNPSIHSEMEVTLNMQKTNSLPTIKH
jgi:hypothetical protein